ncbi:hypothetical protein GQ43DRAFT_419638 [Delitschia confertaspora ATCC 74209]|uniref:Uncharacterized protein n=1 Tax=Delitschia confertaspora ATCC 74209 TaxID=1513339 RepID=A0A9P4JNH5_9PLEO|nr:hypothetical protein GQ43DRAFT_419638 [Delitschia confertaspora ATCC 74209]
MSSPPRTPTHAPTSHRRHPSSLDMSYTNSPLQSYAMRRRSSSFRSSPISRRSSQHYDDSGLMHDGSGDNGLGNLADELADAWDEDEEVGEEEEDEEGEEVGDMGLSDEEVNATGDQAVHHDLNGETPLQNGVRDSGVALQTSPSQESRTTLSPQTAKGSSRRHTRQKSLYDGSDYGDESDLEANELISAGLEARMAAVESLARRGMEENGSSADGVVRRVTERLRDLGSQAGVESGATRLKTAHDALTSHLHHQTRTLTSLSSSLLSPLAIPPDPDTIDTLLPLISSTLDLLPHSSTEPLYALSQLTLSTRELLQHLSYVSDSLHMSRQSTGIAARRLKSAKEQLGEWKRESEMRDQGVRWIEKGEWERRLGEREAAKGCKGVVDGFEEVCGMWRARLCEGLGVANA